MAELEPAGYRWLRALVFARWRYLAVLDPDGRELCRLDTQTDARVARTLNDATAEVEIAVSLRGDDPEFAASLPVRIAATCLYADAAAGDARSQVTYTPASLAEPTDGVDLTHVCHIPSALLGEVLNNGS